MILHNGTYTVEQRELFKTIFYLVPELFFVYIACWSEDMGKEVSYNAWEQLLPQLQQNKIKQPPDNTRFVSLLTRRMAWGCGKFFLGSSELAIATELLHERGSGSDSCHKAKWYMLVYIHTSQGQPSPQPMCLGESKMKLCKANAGKELNSWTVWPITDPF